MSISYSIGSLFVGLGAGAVLGVAAWGFYHVSKVWKSLGKVEEKYYLIEEKILDKYAEEKHGFLLDKELLKRKLFKPNEKNIRRNIQKEIYENYFGNKKDNKED